ncbi:MAG TPA: hypothetical protein VD902_05735 [Symbiobacteriaceae bacterium]|nr:hypothetical protein [Symbiobacteriaceae bacterium]
MSRLIAFWSPSGAGATALALNTAAALGAHRAGVVLADLNLVAPSLALAADLLPHDRPQSVCLSRLLPALEGGRLTTDELYRSLLQGNGYALLPGVLDVVAACRVSEGHVQRMLQLLGARYETVLADLTPALDSVACLPVLEMADVVCLVVGPDIGSRFHTRRYMLPVKAMGLDAKCRAVLNRSAQVSGAQVSADIDLPVAATVPDLKIMNGLMDAGMVPYLSQAVHASIRGFKSSIDQLATLLTQGG